MYDMVSDRSSQAEYWTDLRTISMRVFFGSKKNSKKVTHVKHTGRELKIVEQLYILRFAVYTLYK